MNKHYQNLLTAAYKSFNARDIDGLLSVMAPDVHWPNGWEGGYVDGHDEVRVYWTRQWKEINPTVDPIGFREDEDGKVEVRVHQKATDHSGNLLFDTVVNHIYTFENGMIKSMQIKVP